MNNTKQTGSCGNRSKLLLLVSDSGDASSLWLLIRPAFNTWINKRHRSRHTGERHSEDKFFPSSGRRSRKLPIILSDEIFLPFFFFKFFQRTPQYQESLFSFPSLDWFFFHHSFSMASRQSSASSFQRGGQIITADPVTRGLVVRQRIPPCLLYGGSPAV